MTRRFAVAPFALAALVLTVALPASAAPRRARGHIATQDQDCATCHRTGTAAVFADWERSPHGLALVTCVVCHGSTGKDFKAKPASSGCGSCHAAQAASVSGRPVADCFACHAPHSLSAHPHR